MGNRVSTKNAIAALKDKPLSVAYGNGSDSRAAASLFDDEEIQQAVSTVVFETGGEVVIAGSLRLSMTGLQIDGEIDQEQWFSLFNGISSVKRAFQWMRGDWLVYGIKREYGETEAQFNRIALVTGLNSGTLQNIYAVCSNVEIPQRHGNLTFWMHGEVKGLTPDEQTYWLDKAEANKWSVRELRAAIQNKPLPSASPALPMGKAYVKRVNRIAGKLKKGKKLAADEIQWLRTLLDSQET